MPCSTSRPPSSGDSCGKPSTAHWPASPHALILSESMPNVRGSCGCSSPACCSTGQEARPGYPNLHSGPDSNSSFEGNGQPFSKLPRSRLPRKPPLHRPSPVRMRVQTVPFTLHTSASCQPRVRRCSPSPSPQGMAPPCNTYATRPDARLSLMNHLIPTSWPGAPTPPSNFLAQPCSLTCGVPDEVPRRAPADTRPKLSGSFWMTRPRSTPSGRSPPASHVHSCLQPLRKPLVWGGSLPFANLPEGFGALSSVITCAGWLPGLWLNTSPLRSMLPPGPTSMHLLPVLAPKPSPTASSLSARLTPR